MNDVNSFIAKNKKKPLKAIVEGVHPNACGIRAFVNLDGNHYYLTVNIAGIRGPTEESNLRPRAIYYLEIGLLQQVGFSEIQTANYDEDFEQFCRDVLSRP